MVKIITSEEELKKYVNEDVDWEDKTGYVVRMTLTPDDIERFRREGYFAYLKRELAILHEMRFACTEEPTTRKCSYFFISPTPELMDRITGLVCSLYHDDEKIPLVKCSPSPRKDVGGVGGIKGSLKACKLF